MEPNFEGPVWCPYLYVSGMDALNWHTRAVGGGLESLGEKSGVSYQSNSVFHVSEGVVGSDVPFKIPPTTWYVTLTSMPR